ncbi:MAG TPA: dienelactone hydrolase family protein [Chitinophagaceae bacterium]|nr:dienelactone hydrolase family protein [Chitinophagaceae bacterium]
MELRFHDEVEIPVGKVVLKGELTVPLKASGIVIFSHGSGSSRLSPRNKMVAHYLLQRNFGTLLFDLLTEKEDEQYHNRFDIELLTRRLIGATEWLEQQPAAVGCRLGYFGASTGAASALKAAAYLTQIAAVVSRGGRPDLAMDVLNKVEAPTLFIIGGLDYDVIRMNREAYSHLTGEKRLEIIEGATHLFEERGKMDEVCELAGNWFDKYLHALPTEANNNKLYQ